MHRLPGVSIKLFEREYDLAFGRQASGANWLAAVNKDTGAILPLTPVDRQSTPGNAVDVLDVENIVPVLEAAGVIKRQGPSEVSWGFKLRRCEIVHPELIERLAGLEAENLRIEHEHEGHSR
jgi:hypothetical protein